MTEAAQIDEHISGFKTSMEKLNVRLDELKKEEETIHQAIKKYEGALEYANILRSQLPEKVVMNDVKDTPLPPIPETKAEEDVKQDQKDIGANTSSSDTNDETNTATSSTTSAATGAKKKKKR